MKSPSSRGSQLRFAPLTSATTLDDGQENEDRCPARDVRREAMGSALYSKRKQDTNNLSEKSSKQRKETI